MRFFRLISAYGWSEVTYAVYAFQPLSLRALQQILHHMVHGEQARFQRFVADKLFWIAAGKKIDANKSERFGRQLEDIYRNPFKPRPAGPQTRQEIEQYIIKRLTE